MKNSNIMNARTVVYTDMSSRNVQIYMPRVPQGKIEAIADKNMRDAAEAAKSLIGNIAQKRRGGSNNDKPMVVTARLTENGFEVAIGRLYSNTGVYELMGMDLVAFTADYATNKLKISVNGGEGAGFYQDYSLSRLEAARNDIAIVAPHIISREYF